MSADRRPPGPRDWKCDYSIDATAVHIRPRNDLMWHDLDDDCPCGPQSQYLDVGTDCRWLILHHALDGRGRSQGGYSPTPGPTGATREPPGDGLAAC